MLTNLPTWGTMLIFSTRDEVCRWQELSLAALTDEIGPEGREIESVQEVVLRHIDSVCDGSCRSNWIDETYERVGQRSASSLLVLISLATNSVPNQELRDAVERLGVDNAMIVERDAERGEWFADWLF